MVRVFSRRLGNDVERPSVTGTQSIRRLTLTVKYVEGGFAEERKANTNRDLVLGEAFLAPAGKDWVFF